MNEGYQLGLDVEMMFEKWKRRWSKVLVRRSCLLEAVLGCRLQSLVEERPTERLRRNDCQKPVGRVILQ
jgi:hypothetical protein